MDTTYRTPFLKDGMLVHMPYTTYAHWYQDHDDIDMILMKRSLTARRRYGKWDGEWFEHPNPNMGEPHRAMSWI